MYGVFETQDTLQGIEAGQDILHLLGSHDTFITASCHDTTPIFHSWPQYCTTCEGDSPRFGRRVASSDCISRFDNPVDERGTRYAQVFAFHHRPGISARKTHGQSCQYVKRKLRLLKCCLSWPQFALDVKKGFCRSTRTAAACPEVLSCHEQSDTTSAIPSSTSSGLKRPRI